MPVFLLLALTAGILAAACMCALLLQTITAIRRRILHLPTPAPWWPPQGDLVAAGASDEMAALIAGGGKINAIKMYREETGVGLYEAKSAVDDVLIRARAKRVMEAGGSEPVADLLARERVTGAIRAYRQETGVSQREAKAYVTALRVRAQA